MSIPNLNHAGVAPTSLRVRDAVGSWMSRLTERGILDIGLTGQDWIIENEADVVEVADLVYSKKTSSPYGVFLTRLARARGTSIFIPKMHPVITLTSLSRRIRFPIARSYRRPSKTCLSPGAVTRRHTKRWPRAVSA